MATIWKSGDKNSGNQPTNHNISGNILSSWSRQQKLATISAFAMLGLLIAFIACSTQSAKPALVAVSGPAALSATPALAPVQVSPRTSIAAMTPLPAKKPAKKRPANVTYNDANSGISFLYPRKFALATGDKAQPKLAAVGDVPMNFVHDGGVAVATVALPAKAYPGTDFESAFFNVNVNRSVSAEECGHFAFVDTRNADGEAVDAEKVKVGAAEMEMTSDFTANIMRQAETEYYHSYENGACYEYVLGLGTQGFATEGGIRHVDRDEVFAKLEKILATVKIKSSQPEQASEQPYNRIVAGKE